MKTIYAILLLVIGLASTNSFSQEDSTKVEKKFYLIVKNDGSEYRGYILSDDGREILLQTENIGKMYINKSEIQSISEVDKLVTKDGSAVGEYSDLRNDGPFTTRYYFTTNALPVKKKESYALIHLYGPEVHFAVSDNLSVGVMATWIASPIALALKYSFDNPNPDSDVHFAIGGIFGSGGYLNPASFGGLYFATVTKGSRSSNMSFSTGYAHINTGSLFLPNNSYDGKYSYQGHNMTEEYFVPYEAQPNFEYETLSSTPRNNGSLIFGISGIKSIGKKASFIFDSMIFITKRSDKAEYTDVVRPFTLSTTENGVITETIQNYTIGEGILVSDGFKPTIVLMPGVRFSQGKGRAIQVVLSGIIFESTGSSGGKSYYGVPIPMVSWLRAF